MASRRVPLSQLSCIKKEGCNYGKLWHTQLITYKYDILWKRFLANWGLSCLRSHQSANSYYENVGSKGPRCARNVSVFLRPSLSWHVIFSNHRWYQVNSHICLIICHTIIEIYRVYFRTYLVDRKSALFVPRSFEITIPMT